MIASIALIFGPVLFLIGLIARFDILLSLFLSILGPITPTSKEQSILFKEVGNYLLIIGIALSAIGLILVLRE
jgi:hypothetical protein